MSSERSGLQRWPDIRAVLGCSVLAAVVVWIDGYFSAQEGYLSRPPDYDGVGYMVYGRTVYQLVVGFHLHSALVHLMTIAPGWTAALAFQYLVLGAGAWQAFSVRFWAVALLLILVYWIVRRRAPRPLAIAAVLLTTLLPMISAGVRSSSLEFLSGQSNYLENWYLDDLRPDILAIALILWSVAILAEHSEAPTRSAYLASAAFAASAILVKPSTSPLLLLSWTGALAVVWFVNRRRVGVLRGTALAVALLALLLAPWATIGGGIASVVGYVYESSVTFHSVYGTNENLLQRLAYFAVRIPTDLGPIEAWAAIAAALVATIALARRRLGAAELIYGAVAFGFYVTFGLATTRNSHFPEWISMALWIYAWAGFARLATARWEWRPRATPALLGAVGLYTLIVYGLGAFALVNWPAREHRFNEQLSAVTASLAGELSRHITSSDCFVSAPGSGWPDSIDFVLIDAKGSAPFSLGLNPSVTPADYVQAVKTCAAVTSWREDITQVAQAFPAPPPYQPYYRAIDEYVRSPASGYALDRSWSFSDLPPYGAHTLGQYQGVSLTLDLFLRGQGQS